MYSIVMAVKVTYSFGIALMSVPLLLMVSEGQVLDCPSELYIYIYGTLTPNHKSGKK